MNEKLKSLLICSWKQRTRTFEKMPKLPRFWFFTQLKLQGFHFMVFFTGTNSQSKLEPASNSKLIVHSNYKAIPVEREKSWEIVEVNETWWQGPKVVKSQTRSTANTTEWRWEIISNSELQSAVRGRHVVWAMWCISACISKKCERRSHMKGRLQKRRRCEKDFAH